MRYWWDFLGAAVFGSVLAILLRHGVTVLRCYGVTCYFVTLLRVAVLRCCGATCRWERHLHLGVGVGLEEGEQLVGGDASLEGPVHTVTLDLAAHKPGPVLAVGRSWQQLHGRQ